MRPLRIDLHGFTVFREPTTVDLTDADFFALVGPTGSGKSTVLDAICFALYGTVPRWGNRRHIENALAPSAAEARVRLVFEASGARFVATRVVRRDGKGRVATSHAGLEQLPAGFDLASFDTAPADRDTPLGTVLAGTPAEMDAAVLAAVGLPYEQFTSCVVLPQGEFARFLHAKPADRQEILVNLLGLHVYRRIGARAGVAQKEAEAAAAATRSLLADVTGADDAALVAAEQALARARALADEVESLLPALVEASTTGAAAQSRLTQVEAELAALAAVRVPEGVASLGEEIASARDAAQRAELASHEAEELEEKQRAEVAALGDRTALQRLLDAHTARATLANRVAELGAARTTAAKQQATLTRQLAAANEQAQRAAQALAAAQAEVERAQSADRAGVLRAHLVTGQPCPVCEQVVQTVPASSAPALAAARRAHAEAEQALAAANQAVAARDRALRAGERAVAATTAQHEESAERLATLDDQLVDAPAQAAIEATLAAIVAGERAVADAAHRVKTSRQAARAAASAARAAEEKLRRAWTGFDAARDTVASYAPPTPDRSDLVGSWHSLATWATGAKAQRQAYRDEVLAEAERALGAIQREVEQLASAFAGAGSRSPGGTDPAAYRQAAALAVERAGAAHDRVLERRAQATRLATQLAQHERAALVAKSLAQHLRADRFERWLLAEALDALVAGASRILRQLSHGQYDLTHDKGEFYVIDHAEASLSRAVRTLSGGETFQASLALALALSEQLAGLSTAAASLESILLDEGFGTLDAGTLETVAATLENLAAAGDRSVGVVTHVPALAERIPVRFEVSRDARGGAHITRVG